MVEILSFGEGWIPAVKLAEARPDPLNYAYTW